MSYLDTARASLEQAEPPASEETLQVAAMPLSEFANAGLIVRVRSAVLGCEVLFVSDNVPDSEIPETPPTVYRAHELRKLAKLKPAPTALATIHEVKAIFGGQLEEAHDA